MENSERLRLLLEKYLHGQLSPAEVEEFNNYLEYSAYENEIKKYIGEFFAAESLGQSLSVKKKDVILMNILGSQHQERNNVRKISSTMRKIAVAATIICVGTIAFLKFRSPVVDKFSKDIFVDKSLKLRGALLTLADGRTVNLVQDSIVEIFSDNDLTVKKTNNGEIAYIVKGNTHEDGGFHRLATGNGQTYRVVLPDGSIVHLNAASSITYSPNLRGDSVRKVNLTGEAFFDISKDRSRPFIVVSHGQEIRVMGTRFNVCAYAEENKIATVLFSGAVKLKSGTKIINVLPGQQVLNEQGILHVAKIDTAKAVAWRSGYFRFENSDIQTVMNQISRWYGVEVFYNSTIDKAKINAKINQNRPLDEVLMLLEASGRIKFKREGRRVIVM